MDAHRRRMLARLPALAGGAVLGTAGLVGGCAGLFGPPTVTLSAREIDSLLARRFPLERRVLEVVDLTLAAPRVRLLPERNRLGAALDLGARDRLLGSQWKGRLDFEAALRWDAGDRSVRLAQVRVQDFTLDGGAAASRSAVERLGGALIERLLEDQTIYTLPAERAEELRRRGWTPARVSVGEAGVEIGFERAAK